MSDNGGTSGVTYFQGVGQASSVHDGAVKYDREHGSYSNALVERGRARASSAAGSSQRKNFNLVR